MALITNAQAIAFENVDCRAYAEKITGAYYAAKLLRAKWTAQNLSAVIPNNADTFNDGAQTDGRPIVTGGQVNILIARCDEIIADFEASANLKLNTLLGIAVTPR